MDSSPTPTVVLQTAIASETHSYLRLESLRRHITMGQLLDEIIAQRLSIAISQTTS